MANTQGEVVITPDTLNKSFVKYRKELLMMPVYGLQKILPYVSLRQGVRYKEVVGQLEGDMQLAPYDPKRTDNNDVKITGRELETFLGSCVKGFDPNSVVQSIYGSNIVQGDGLKNVPVTKAVCAFLMGKLGEHLYDSIFTAKRNATGKTTADLFDGFKTIVDKEVTAKTISTANKNLVNIETVTRENAEDTVNDIYDATHNKLKDQDTLMFMNVDTKLLYERSYQDNHGSLPYNTQFNKSTVEGSGGRCTMVGLSCVPKDFFMVTPRRNLLVGIATSGAGVTFEVQKSLTSHFWLDFVASMFFGVQFETVSPEMLLIAQPAAAAGIDDGEEEEPGGGV